MPGPDQRTIDHADALAPERLPALEALRAVALQHAGGSLVALDIDPAAYPDQLESVVSGYPQSAETVLGMARSADRRFGGWYEAQRDNSDARAAVDDAIDALDNNGNVVIVTPHGDVLDIGFAHAAVQGLMHDARPDYKPPHSGFIAGRMTTFLAYDFGHPIGVQPTTAALKLMCDTILLTIPRTQSAVRNGLHLLEGENNRQVADTLERLQKAGGLLLGAAPSGGTAKPIDGVRTMERPSKGTRAILRDENTRVLTTLVWRGPGPGVFEIQKGLSDPRTDEDVDALLHGMASALTSRVAGETFAYAGTPDGKSS